MIKKKDFLKEYNIEKETGIKRYYMILEPTINIKQYKYKVNDFYSGEEPIDLTLNLGYAYDFDEKNAKDSEKDKFPYKNKDFITLYIVLIRLFTDSRLLFATSPSLSSPSGNG